MYSKILTCYAYDLMNTYTIHIYTNYNHHEVVSSGHLMCRLFKIIL